MNERTIAEYTREELDALRARLENGRDVLRDGEALLNKKEAVQDVGSTPGIGSGRYDASTAYRKADGLMRMRVEADYGPSSSAEPYDRAHIDEWLETANDLVRDLETLL